MTQPPDDTHALAAPCMLAAWLRRGALCLAILVFVVFIVTPAPNGIVGAGRLIALWPAFLANVVLLALWSWRIGHAQGNAAGTRRAGEGL